VDFWFFPKGEMDDDTRHVLELGSWKLRIVANDVEKLIDIRLKRPVEATPSVDRGIVVDTLSQFSLDDGLSTSVGEEDLRSEAILQMKSRFGLDDFFASCLSSAG